MCTSVGGNTGIGKETVKVRYANPFPFPLPHTLIEPQQLLAHNATVYLAARSAQKANEAIAELKNETGKQAIFLQLDLSDLLAVRKSVQEFLSYVPCFGELSCPGSQHVRVQEREPTTCPYQQCVSFGNVWTFWRVVTRSQWGNVLAKRATHRTKV